MAAKAVEPHAPPDTPLVLVEPSNPNEDQLSMHKKVLDHFSRADYVLPAVTNISKLNDPEKFWLSQECLYRYLRASKWKVDIAIKRLEETLKWRREYGIEDIVTASHVEPEAVTGKEILFGYDYWGRPAFYMIPSRQNTDTMERQIQFAVWMLERGIDLMGPGVETVDLLINFGDKAKNPSLSQGRAFLDILQSHYPERLGLALVINVPYLVNMFFKLITPFIDPLTRTKIKFNPMVIGDGPAEGKETFFLADQVMKNAWSGSVDFDYVHDKYWPKLVSLCESRRELWMQNWRNLGGTVGIKESNYKRPPTPESSAPS